MDTLSLTAFGIMGLTGSLHCAGMCGPIIWVMPFQHRQGWRRWLAITLYHAGRIGAYCLLASLFFSIRAAFDPRWQQGVALFTGGLLLLFGILSFTGAGTGRVLRPLANLLTRPLGALAGRSSSAWLALTGLLNGLLPCGMVYMALPAAMKGADAAQALLSMACFGLGTVPMLLAVTLLRRRIRFSGARWTNAVILVFGLLIMLRGANLGVPYLSPERTAAKAVGAPSLNCCHKPGK